jgi:hypothetical protein
MLDLFQLVMVETNSRDHSFSGDDYLGRVKHAKTCLFLRRTTKMGEPFFG